MSDGVAEKLSLFQSELVNRRFSDGTLQILESVLVTKDVKSLLEIRSGVRELLLSESVRVLQDIAEKTVEQKLSILEFFVRAFALIGDVESCLALRYEALILRELKTTNHHWLHVSYEEWLTFAEQSLDNGYYAVAVKGCDKAFLCLDSKTAIDSKSDGFYEYTEVVDKIKKVKNIAEALVSSNSVQAQTTNYLQRKTFELSEKHGSYSTNKKGLAISSVFRKGIKKHNIRKLLQHRQLQQITGNHMPT